MAIQISITGLTQQQQTDIGNAFDETIAGRTDAGLTKAQWVERCLLRHIKAVVKGWKRKAHETALMAEHVQVDADFPEV